MLFQFRHIINVVVPFTPACLVSEENLVLCGGSQDMKQVRLPLKSIQETDVLVTDSDR